MISREHAIATIRSSSLWRQTLALTEVLALWGFLLILLRGDAVWWPALEAWQKEALGGPFLFQGLFFFVLPVGVLLLARRSPQRHGMALRPVGPSARLAWRAFSVIGPFLPVFSLVAFLGWSFTGWRGALVLAPTFLLSFALVVRVTSSFEPPDERPSGWGDTGVLFLALAVGAGIAALAWPEAQVLARAVLFFLFVGFGEELFFRGYVQSRLNRAFGRPWRLGGARVGAGLLMAALVFGAMHALASPPHSSVAWALWTIPGGLTFGYLREKGGSILACAIAHGLFDLPLAFFGA
jgi:membrane protease YdiL (CAAX protease family)